MNILTQELPCAVKIGGVEYPIFTDFRDWLNFFELLDDKELTERHRFETAMHWYTDKIPANPEEAFSALLGFALCEDIPKAGKKRKPDEDNNTRAPVFSWLYDAPFIVGAFMQVYGIDLLSTNMHWYSFIALFQALPEDVPLKQRISLRQTNTAEIKDRAQSRRIRRAQLAIAIPRPLLSAEQVGSAFG